AAHFDHETFHGKRPPAASLMFGSLGARWVAALAWPSTVASFVRALRGPSAAEYATGLAGRLQAALLLHRREPSEALARAADRLGTMVSARVCARAAQPWEPADANRFAHGWSGPVHAVLAWYDWRGDAVPG